VNRILGLSAALFVLLAVALIGLRVPPQPFPPVTTGATNLERVALPAGLPAPVDRFYRSLYGSTVPVIESAVVSGRATLRIMGVSLPARFRFTHDVGDAYRHEIVATWYGIPILRVNETYLGGVARLELPFGVEEGPAVNQGANLALWAEAMWFPAALVTDPRARWDVVDASTALLHVPYGGASESLVARFDASRSRLVVFEAMRYRGQDAIGKTLWLTAAEAWGEVNGHPTATHTTVQWFDEGRPWADFTVDDVAFNVPDVDARLQRTSR